MNSVSQNDKKQIEDTTSNYKDQAAMRMSTANDRAEGKLSEMKVTFIWSMNKYLFLS